MKNGIKNYKKQQFLNRLIFIVIDYREQSNLTEVMTQNQFQSTSSKAKHLAIAVAQIEEFAIAQIEKEVEKKQLYYHNAAHAKAVKRRANQILAVVAPYYQLHPQQLQKIHCLLDICAIAHDMVQDYLPIKIPHTPRKRETGVSEAATIKKLLKYIDQLNLEYQQNISKSPLFTPVDLATIRETIETTICLVDCKNHSVYQPNLYDQNKNISLPAKIIALADLGALGMEGIESFLAEGSLIFLEENPDIIPLIHLYEADKKVFKLKPEYVYLKDKLLQQAQFEIDFAKGRLTGLNQELATFPPPVRQTLKTQVFKYLTPETIQTIEKTTPTDPKTNLSDLLKFFNFSQYFDKK